MNAVTIKPMWNGMSASNPVGIQGIDFIEFTSHEPERLHQLFVAFGFSRLKRHQQRKVDYYRQNDIYFLLNYESGTHADQFCQQHGPSICSMGWKVESEELGLQAAIAKGATVAPSELNRRGVGSVPAVYGIGESLLYLVERGFSDGAAAELGFVDHPEPVVVAEKGFVAIDHLTNNVEKGTMQHWASFYKEVFGFTEVRYFDIRGAKTGLVSYALKSPCGSFCIPINEGTEDRSQINEYLREYRGPGIQHLAFLTGDILSSLRQLEDTRIETLDIESAYYRSVFDRVPNVTEDHGEIERRKVLVDGDEEGYLLQIFTKNLIGPIFIEIIQRKNHLSFGEGNFGALFRSIERDQEKRGVL